jgi:hypothetical protein
MLVVDQTAGPHVAPAVVARSKSTTTATLLTNCARQWKSKIFLGAIIRIRIHYLLANPAHSRCGQSRYPVSLIWVIVFLNWPF